MLELEATMKLGVSRQTVLQRVSAAYKPCLLQADDARACESEL